MKIQKQFIRIMMICILLLSFHTSEVIAAEANITVSTATAEEGEDVTVNVTVSSGESIGTYEIYLLYDESILEYKSGASGGGGGKIQISNSEETTSKSTAIVFTAKKAGSTDISVNSNDSSVLPLQDDDSAMNIKAEKGSVTVTEPVTVSGNNKLISLVVTAVLDSGGTREVQLTPGFSPDLMEYRADLDEDVASLSLTATPEDNTAQLTVRRTRIDPGDNLTYVSVIAANGEERRYNIYTTKPLPGTTVPGEEQPEVPAEGIQVVIEDVTYTIANQLEDDSIPKGFEETIYDYQEQKVKAIKGTKKKLIAMYLIDSEDKGAFYIYDEKDDSFYRMYNIKAGNKLYTMVKMGKKIKMPDGYTLHNQKISGNTLKVYKKDKGSEFCLIYAMNEEGSPDIYIYDRKDKTMQRYSKEAEEGIDNPIDTSIDPSADAQEEMYLEMEKSLDALQKKYDNNNSMKWKMIIGLIIICVLLLLLAVYFIIKSRGHKKNDDGDQPGGESGDSAQWLDHLSMIAAANESKIMNRNQKDQAIVSEESQAEQAASVQTLDAANTNQATAMHEQDLKSTEQTASAYDKDLMGTEQALSLHEDLHDLDIESRINKMARDLEISLNDGKTEENILPDFDTGSLPNMEQFSINNMIIKNNDSGYEFLDGE